MAESYEARVRLPRWDAGIVHALHHAQIEVFRQVAPTNEPVEVTLELVATSPVDARLRVGRALDAEFVRLAPADFIRTDSFAA